jgi:hypothetical protein
VWIYISLAARALTIVIAAAQLSLRTAIRCAAEPKSVKLLGVEKHMYLVPTGMLMRVELIRTLYATEYAQMPN